MIWLGICDEEGNALYFDIHRVERKRSRRRWRHVVNGICGNGLFETDVLVEIGDDNEVTYVDLSTGVDSRYRLLAGVDAGSLEQRLVDVVSERCRDVGGRVQASPHPVVPSGCQVAEPPPEWSAAI
ncbi:MAG: hypothetical protein C0615_00100 [Desulfuromonas sp.]|nr:MAG: hypothetical protein C0615_00100 [Desulfuromonas sp.]